MGDPRGGSALSHKGGSKFDPRRKSEQAEVPEDCVWVAKFKATDAYRDIWVML